MTDTPRRTNVRRGASNAPQLLPLVPTFLAPVHRESRAAFLAAPRWAPVESFPAEPVPPIASVGERKPADGYLVGRVRYVPGSGLRKILAPDERPSRRIKRAATLASDSDVSSSGPPEKPRGLLAAPRWAPVDSFPPERFRPLLRLGKGNPLTVIPLVAGDMFPAPVFGQSSLRTNVRRGALNAPQLLPPVPTFPAPVPRRSRAARGRAPLPPRPRRGSTSRPAGHLWASPFLRARKPKSSGGRRAGR
ncbi:MAG: hypothetical protein IPN90_12045 [Elusimicrobia bacterium]|nr:hypothetical protein [Elusimicrobiota bacterium]